MKNSLKGLLFLFLFVNCFCSSILAQKQRQVNFVNSQSCSVGNLSGEFILDGEMKEPSWRNLSPATDFVLKFPTAGNAARNQTSVKMFQDGTSLYIGISCVDPDEEKTSQLTGIRDFSPSRNDAVSILFDPYSDGTNGFMFSITPFGVQQEAIVYEGSKYDNLWDRPWMSKVSRKPNGWEAEMVIPLTSLHFPAGKSKWRVNFLRFDLGSNEVSSWAPVPLTFNEYSLAFGGEMNWEIAPVWAKATLAINPGTSSSNSYLDGLGIAAKSSLNSSLSLDASLNLLRVDETNFKRYYSMENPDLFNPGYQAYLFYGSDGFGNGSSVEAKLTGKLNDNLRLGVISSQRHNNLFGDFAFQNNITSATIQQKVFTRSAFTALITNQVGSDSSKIDWKTAKQNIGVNYSHRSANDRWNAGISASKVFGGDSSGIKAGGNSFLQYSTSKWRVLIQNTTWSPFFHAGLYNEGNSQFSTSTNIGLNHYYFPANRKLFRYGWGLEAYFGYTHFIYNNNFEVIQAIGSVNYMFEWKNRSYLNLQMRTNVLNEAWSNNNNTFINQSVVMGTDFRKKFSVSGYAMVNGGNQNLYTFGVSPRMRINQKGYLEMSVRFEKTQTGSFYNNYALFQHSVSFNYAIQNNLFLNCSLGQSFQDYSSGIPDLWRNESSAWGNLQWRFRPMSDINVGFQCNYRSTYPKGDKINFFPTLGMNWWISSFKTKS